MSRKYDLVVIGCGPGGYAAALEGAAHGLRVAVVERGLPGGTCLNWGCIPTKLFLGAAAPLADLEALSRVRLMSGRLEVDLAALQKRRDQIVTATRKAMIHRLEQASVSLLEGEARFTGPQRIQVNTDPTLECRFEACILAGGSQPKTLPGIMPDGEVLLDSTQLLARTQPPGHLVVIGAGAIGLELAQFFNLLGSRISVVEALPRIAPGEDPEISQVLARTFKRNGWNLYPGERIQRVEVGEREARLTLESGVVVIADAVLIAAGRTADLHGLEVDRARIVLDSRGFVAVDEHLKAAPAIYAVGDCNGRMLLAHAAEHQALYAVHHLMGKNVSPYRDHPLPSCMYGPLEVMRAGFSARELLSRGLTVHVSRYALAGNPIAQSHAAVHGLIKVLWNNGRIMGIAAVGHGVSGLVTLGEIMTTQTWTRDQVEECVFAHPTLDEALKQAALAEQLLLEDSK